MMEDADAASALARPLLWRETGRAEFPYAAEVDGQHWEIRINDFPAEVMYTLLVAGREVAEFDDWPQAWRRER